MPDPPLPELIQLCERVLAADITEEELKRSWPEEPEDLQLGELRETLFSGLEHLPGRLVNGEWRLDPDAWRGTVEHDDIEFYLRRLRQASG
jgi:hypothetical protein